MYTRKETRTLVMQILYEISLREDESPEKILKERLEPIKRDKDLTYAKSLVEAYLNHQEQINKALETCLTNWNIQSMNRVDLSLLRLAIVEISYLDFATQVSINEAIELAKTFSSSQAPSFINGVLGEYVRLYHE